MRKLLFIIATLTPFLALGQVTKNMKKHRRLLAHSEFLAEVKVSEYLVHPQDYIPSYCDTVDIDYIEFIRDTNYNNTRPIYASINQKDGFDKIYSIGSVSNYQRSETELSFMILMHMKNGSIDSRRVLFDFSNGVTSKEYDYKEADYDVDGDPFWDEFDGMVVVAL